MTWLIIGLFLAVVVAVIAIFIIVKNLIIKMAAGFVLALSAILVLVFFENDFKSATKPLAMDDDNLIIYQKDEDPLIIPYDDISRVYVGKPGSDIKIEVIYNTGSVAVEVSDFSYEWAIKNELGRKLKGKVDTAQF